MNPLQGGSRALVLVQKEAVCTANTRGRLCEDQFTWGQVPSLLGKDAQVKVPLHQC